MHGSVTWACILKCLRGMIWCSWRRRREFMHNLRSLEIGTKNEMIALVFINCWYMLTYILQVENAEHGTQSWEEFYQFLLYMLQMGVLKWLLYCFSKFPLWNLTAAQSLSAAFCTLAHVVIRHASVQFAYVHIGKSGVLRQGKNNPVLYILFCL